MLSTVHVHSSVASVPPQLLSCLGPRHTDSYARHMFQLGFTLIWKDGEVTWALLHIRLVLSVRFEQSYMLEDVFLVSSKESV